jgi:hypothetical protein
LRCWATTAPSQPLIPPAGCWRPPLARRLIDHTVGLLFDNNPAIKLTTHGFVSFAPQDGMSRLITVQTVAKIHD